MEQIITIPVIVAIIYAVLALYKSLCGNAEKFIKIIPVIAAFLGAALGVLTFYLAPEIMPADNILTALLFGGASGLAATGTNQVFKQLTKSDSKNDGDVGNDGGKPNG